VKDSKLDDFRKSDFINTMLQQEKEHETKVRDFVLLKNAALNSLVFLSLVIFMFCFFNEFKYEKLKMFINNCIHN
jgi:hypothetical protein